MHGKSLYGAGRYVIVGSKGKIITSTGDLQAWSALTSPTVDRLEDVTFANNLFVAVGENGTILTSSDGLGWTNRRRGANQDLDGLAVAVGKNGAILTSTDGTAGNYRQAPGGASLHGVAWDEHSYPSGKNARAIAFANGLNVIALNDGGILTSTNAQTWRSRLAPTYENLHAVRYINNTFIAIGNVGTILQNAPLVPQMLLAREGQQLRLILSSPYEGVFKLQQTDNFIWVDLASLTNATGTAEYVLPLPPGSGQKSSASSRRSEA